MLKDTADNSRSGLNEDFVAKFTKQEKDLLGVQVVGGSDGPDFGDRNLGLGPEKQKMIKQILTLRGLTEAHQNHEEELYGNRAKFVLHEHGQ